MPPRRTTTRTSVDELRHTPSRQRTSDMSARPDQATLARRPVTEDRPLSRVGVSLEPQPPHQRAPPEDQTSISRAAAPRSNAPAPNPPGPECTDHASGRSRCRPTYPLSDYRCTTTPPRVTPCRTTQREITGTSSRSTTPASRSTGSAATAEISKSARADRQAIAALCLDSPGRVVWDLDGRASTYPAGAIASSPSSTRAWA